MGSMALYENTQQDAWGKHPTNPKNQGNPTNATNPTKNPNTKTKQSISPKSKNPPKAAHPPKNKNHKHPPNQFFCTQIQKIQNM